MTPFFWRTALVSLFACALPLMAGAQTSGCTGDLMNAAYSADTSPDTAHLKCDLERASKIRDRARKYYGASGDAVVEIIDTASPSGAAYIYSVLADGAKLRLEAQSVPEGRGPRCQMKAALADDTANAMSILMSQLSDDSVPDYGPREDVTVNPDGSRTVRLVFDSHDIITRTVTERGVRNFSRHAGSDDPVNRLNNLVIGVANVSPLWSCSSS